MKKNKIILFFLMLFSNYLFCQVRIDGITVNNTSISGTTINLGASSSVSVYLNAAVNLSSTPSDTYPGTIKIYYKKTSTSPAIVANGGDGGSLFFLGATFAIRSFRLTLDGAQFDTTGGILYAEYKTYSGIITKSSNISIKKDTTAEPGGEPGGGEPGGPGGGIDNGSGGCYRCSSETVPFGGISILPRSAPTSETDGLKWFIVRPTGEHVPYSRVKEIYEPLQLVLKNEQDQSGSFVATHNIYTDRPYSRTENFIQRLNISNSIEQTQTIEYGGTPQTIIGTAGSVNGQPNTTYQWQVRIVAQHQDYISHYNLWKRTYEWKNIPGANQINYTPPSNATEVRAYRRLIFDTRNTAMSSNEVTVYVVSTGDINNTICCDATYFTGSTISPITGSPVIDATFYPQWQKGVMFNNQIVWSNIDNVYSNDYTPVRPGGRPGSGTFYYRRALIHRLNNKFYLSNTVTIVFSNASGRSSEIIKSEKKSNIDIIVYPNPSSSIVNIESGHDLSAFNIKIMDITGRLVLKNNYELNGHSTQLDISELPSGVYNIIIDNGQDKVTKKLIKK